jgi:formylglycine-generating enzyme required for sulfatase activity
MTALDALRMLRGGSWGDFPRFCRSALRDRLGQAVCTFDAIGFRVVCLPREAKPAPIVSRGGAWCNSFLWRTRSAYRDCRWPHRADDLDGFRVVCLHPTPQDFTWLA